MYFLKKKTDIPEITVVMNPNLVNAPIVIKTQFICHSSPSILICYTYMTALSMYYNIQTVEIHIFAIYLRKKTEYNKLVLDFWGFFS